jgi:hypothetical protein
MPVFVLDRPLWMKLLSIASQDLVWCETPTLGSGQIGGGIFFFFFCHVKSNFW